MRRHGRIGSPEGATDRTGGSAMPASRDEVPDLLLVPECRVRAGRPAGDPSHAVHVLGGNGGVSCVCTARGQSRS
ncbi:hypothetical protein C5746_13865 [Streptomyces atratus]|uniref:Uncharacterized protein n=1 Tax=Streptomyces atratus TaxID=1893 RepID=A0A2Z5JR79_STRAR|nr:hypothetical protein C5746_13865 [Streptomyces atratus]